MKNIKKGNVDKKFLWIILILLAVGVLTYISTSLSVYTEDSGHFWSLVLRHVGLGVVGGLIAMFAMSHVNYQHLKNYALYIFIASLLLTLLVHVPGIGFGHGGAVRWINLGFVTFQPSELLKFGTILILSAWLAKHAASVKEAKFGLIPFGIMYGAAFAVLAVQPDTGTIALIGLVSFTLYWIRGAYWKHILIIAVSVVAVAAVYTATHPHVIERVKTFMNQNDDPYGSSYQIQQSKIAIGSGKLYGRGLGQSVHKFGPYLPEANSDSIFAIYAEEFGFIGTSLLVGLYLVFAYLGLRVARHAPTAFAQNLAIGIILLIVIQVFFNIAGISGLLPLKGLPLIFMSHGGTALFITLAELGILLNISRYMRVPKRSA